LTNFDFSLTYDVNFLQLQLKRGIQSLKAIDYRYLLCWYETNIKSVEHPTKLEATNRRRKSIQMHKRNVQCQ